MGIPWRRIKTCKFKIRFYESPSISICLSVCLSACLPASESVCLSDYLTIYLPVCLPIHPPPTPVHPPSPCECRCNSSLCLFLNISLTARLQIQQHFMLVCIFTLCQTASDIFQSVKLSNPLEAFIIFIFNDYLLVYLMWLDWLHSGKWSVVFWLLKWPTAWNKAPQNYIVSVNSQGPTPTMPD